MALMALVFSWFGIEFARFGLAQKAEMSRINLASSYISFPVTGLSWTPVLAERLVEDFRGMLGKEEGNDS
ncbi:MAG: hypothetical protein M2R45_02401 [Verrucomicrobia subdivision 3 bacterium]|nr:hypothetical protein [Limisphaerales bacterium]MCS1416393.1 hypothetical protein [Limisphaerales bacterium]